MKLSGVLGPYLPSDLLPDGLRALVVPPPPESTKGGAFLPCGNGDHVVAAVGMNRDYPPSDVAPRAYRMPGSQRVLWEKLPDRPEGFAVIGDAVASFNLRRQGMTMSAIGATILREVVDEADGTIDGIATRASQRLAPWMDIALRMAAARDSFYAGAEFVNFTPPPKEEAEGAAVIAALATEDAEAMFALRKAGHHMDPAALQTPSLQEKLRTWVAGGAGRARPRPTRTAFPTSSPGSADVADRRGVRLHDG